MAVEEKRGCGYRQVGGTYLVGGVFSAPCDRLPFPLEPCPYCGQRVKLTRSFTQINPISFFGNHEQCEDKLHPCIMCDPPNSPCYIMLVGNRHYTTKSFIEEGEKLGVCKRVPYIPTDFELGKTVIYLAHLRAFPGRKEGEEKSGIFSAFVPTKIERLFWESELKGKKGDKLKANLEKSNISPVAIPDGDKDHQ